MNGAKNIPLGDLEARLPIMVKNKALPWILVCASGARSSRAVATAKKLGVSPDRFVVTVDKHGNTSAASIPLAFDVGLAEGKIKRGDLDLMEAMGGGFTWGAIVARY